MTQPHVTPNLPPLGNAPKRFWNWFSLPEELSGETRRIFLLHCASGLFGGLAGGLLGIADVLLKIEMKASNDQIKYLAMISTGMAFLSLIWIRLLRYVPHRQYIRFWGALSAIVLALAALVESPGALICVLIVVAMAGSAITPAINRMIQSNYSGKNRGRFFGYLTCTSTVMVIISAWWASHILKADGMAYQWLFPCAAFISLVGNCMVSLMPIRGAETTRREGWRVMTKDILVTPFKDFLPFSKREKDFMVFELFFFMYGMGFLGSAPLFLFWVTDRLELPFDKATFLTITVVQTANILFSPLVGRFFDRFNPMITMCAANIMLASYMLMIVIGDTYDFTLAGRCIFAVAMIGISMSWNLGGIYFAGNRAVEPFMSMHVALTGLRGILAPYVAVELAGVVGLRAAFLLPTGFFLIAAVGMYALNLDLKRKRQNLPSYESAEAAHLENQTSL